MKKTYEEMKIEMEMIDEFIEEAYEGMVIVDGNGIITKFKYEKVLGIKESDALGKHVTEVIETTRLPQVLKSGKSEIGDIQKINGHDMVTARIPIERNGVIIGAIGTIMFKDVMEVNYMSDYIKTIKSQMNKYKREIKRMNQAKYTFGDIITQDYHMMYIIDTAKRASTSQSTICLVGESGTGKEYFAHAIHNTSQRKFGTFVQINCGAIPSNLMESELFGYESGAFTGASSSGKIGKFELANGGTIFLDEIGTMPLEMQAKLLRVLEEREFERIGGNEKVEVDVRVISATNEDLKELVLQGKFREDLYYRLDVVSLNIPPLRSRHGDIKLLSQHLLKSFQASYDSCPDKFSVEVLTRLESYCWPGNVRELRNVVESAVNMAKGHVINVRDLPEYIRKALLNEYDESCVQINHNDLEMTIGDSLDIKHCVDEFETKLIQEALRRTHGNKTDASKLLGLHRTALYKKINKLGL
ncbi:MAG: sigma 54-interacting transcriptional regulator [Clostridiales bacterium]|nr:sigma 54-interacting transcriptional regulator [Clostridiales bacterium]